MTMPLIGVPGRRASEANNVRGKAISSGRMYADAIHRAGGLPIVIPPSNDPEVIAATIQRCDGIVMPGGGDVNPTCYGHTENAELRGVNDFIDAFEIAAVRAALDIDLPILAICRGHQILNVALGGTLIQHLDTTDDHRDTMHTVQMISGSLVALAMGTHEPFVHSFHHQAIEKLANDLTVVGTHHDGTIEAVQHVSKHWVIGVQWHPEDTAADDASQQGLFDSLIQHVR